MSWGGASLWEMQVILSHFNVTCRIVNPHHWGMFLHHYIRVTWGIKEEMGVWLSFPKSNNGDMIQFS